MKLLPIAALLASLLTTSLAAAQAPNDALYQSLGARPGIHNIVGSMLKGVLADGRIKDVFNGVDMVKLAKLLEQQFCIVAGGPCKYEGRDMQDAHEGMKVTNAEFNALVENLQGAMDQQGVASAVQNKLLARLAPMQKMIVTN
jgi:hemoglobin